MALQRNRNKFLPCLHNTPSPQAAEASWDHCPSFKTIGKPLQRGCLMGWIGQMFLLLGAQCWVHIFPRFLWAYWLLLLGPLTNKGGTNLYGKSDIDVFIYGIEDEEEANRKVAEEWFRKFLFIKSIAKTNSLADSTKHEFARLGHSNKAYCDDNQQLPVPPCADNSQVRFIRNRFHSSVLTLTFFPF